MPSEETCVRCGGRLVAGLCPVCGGKSSGSAPRRRKTVPRALLFSFITLLSLWPLVTVLIWRHHFTTQHARLHRASRLEHEGPIARLSELHGHGIIYLVQFTPHTAGYSADDLARWLHIRYGLDAQVLPPESLPKPAWSGWRRQYIAELLYAEIKRQHPELAVSEDAYLIGLTDADLYSVNNHWSSTFAQRDHERAAIISSALLEDRSGWWEHSPQRAAVNLQARLRRVLLKNVAMLYWHLPVNNDPTSLLHQPEDPDLPTENIYESDLDPAQTRWGQLEGEPCLYFEYSATAGLQIMPGRLIRTCSEVNTPQENDSTELFEVDLRLGLMVDRRTDVWIPGKMPIGFERALRPGWTGDNPFGASGTDSYDSFLASRDNVYISVVADDAASTQLVRDPIWLSYLPWTKYVDTQFSGHYYQMRWDTSPYPHYDLRRYDGRLASYLPCYSSAQYCYLNGVKNTDGQELKFKRDAGRRLLQVSSSDGAWIKLAYGGGHRIEQIDDSRGRTVRYVYNERGQLTTVTFSSGETLSFDYDDANELTTFSASPDGRTTPKVLLRSQYKHGMLESQTLADGSQYTYSYGPVSARATRTVTVKTPDDEVYAIRRFGDLSLVWERNANGRAPATFDDTSIRK